MRRTNNIFLKKILKRTWFSSGSDCRISGYHESVENGGAIQRPEHGYSTN